jgi:dTDP-4-dehydrorhamnose 3,5-epimerase
MIFQETKLKGAFIIDLEPNEDDRGSFARTFCRREFERHGLNPTLAQGGVSFNRRRGTLRGMHYQAAPCQESRVVRCTRGSIHDVIVDVREGSATRLQWLAVELSAANQRMMYIPEGFAHGFQSLDDASEVLYQMSEFYSPEHARGFRWDDPLVQIERPPSHLIISPRDLSYPFLAT